jgi:hypothetical protein
LDYDDGLAARVRHEVRHRRGVVEKRMVGGLAFMLHGNLTCGIRGDELLVRIDPADADAALDEPGTRSFEHRTRPMKGWLLVAHSVLRDPVVLSRWVHRGFDFAGTLKTG